MFSNAKIMIFITAASMILLTGCATILSGATQKITVHSNPSGAHVKFGYQSGFTPITFEVPKGEDYPLIVSRGSNQQVITLERKLDPATFLNLIPPFWPGFVVDAVTGAITIYETNMIEVDFPTARTVKYNEPKD